MRKGSRLGALAARLGGVGGFLLALLLLRVVFLLATLDPAQDRVMEVLELLDRGWSQGPERPLYDREELYTATYAEAVRSSLHLPLAASRFTAYGGGSSILSLLAVPLFAAFGPHYLAFKILPLLVTLLAGLFWFQVVRAWLGLRAAWFFGALYAFAPAVLVRTALIAKGDHPEAMALIGAVLFLATRAAFTRSELPQARWAAAAGLLTGLGVFISYSSIPVLAGGAVAAAILTRLRPRRAWGALALGLGVGLVPWLVSVIATSGQALEIYGQTLSAARPFTEAIRRVGLLLSHGFLAGYDFPGGPGPRALAGFLWVVCVLIGWVSLARAWRTPFALLVMAATAAHLAAYCLRAPDASSRYLIPGYPLLLIAIVHLAGSSWRRLGRVTLVMAVLLGLTSQTHAVFDSRFPMRHAALRGTDWVVFGEIAGQKVSPRVISSLPSRVRPFLWVGYGMQAFTQVTRDRWAAAASSADPSEARWIWEGIGVAWPEGVRGGEAATLLPTLPPDARAALRRGLTRYADPMLAQLAALGGPPALQAFLLHFEPADRLEFRSAAARVLATLATHGIPAGRSLGTSPGHAAQAPELLLEPSELAYGAGWSLYREVGDGDRLRLWTPPAGMWTAPFAADARAGRGSLPLWEGLAAGYETELARRRPQWLLGGTRGPLRLADELTRVTRGLEPSFAQPFYRAAGRAVGRALVDPETPPGRAEAWRTSSAWRSLIPERFQGAFLAGLDET